MRPDDIIIIFWMLNFLAIFFTLIKRLFSSSLLSVICISEVVIISQAILIPACDSSSMAFHMMLKKKQGDNIQIWCTPFPIWNKSIVPCPFLTISSCPAYRFLRRQVRCLPFPSLSEFSTVWCDSHSQSLWHSQQSRNRCLSGTFLLFLWYNKCWQFDLWFLSLFQIQLEYGSSQFMFCWSLAWRILSITLLACKMSAIMM